MNGILNVRKPGGMTSHDVIMVVRRLTGQRRVGHAGTLDPAAEGVLLICVGTATRVVEYLMAGRKCYLATIRLGITTTTDDAEGETVHQVERVDVSRDVVESALISFRGRITQVPPVYSALKHHGQPLHRLARAGVKVEPTPRQVEIFDLRLVDWQPPTLQIELGCSPGTYVRALARDLGERLGCGAHLSHLIRTASGHFTIDDAITLERLRESFAAGQGHELIFPLDQALLHLAAITADGEGARLIVTGRPWCYPTPEKPPTAGELRRLYTPDGTLLALVEYDAAADCWRPRKVLARGLDSGSSR